MPPLEAVKVVVSIVGEFVEQRDQLGTFPSNSPETYLHQTTRRGSSEPWRGQKLVD